MIDMKGCGPGQNTLRAAVLKLPLRWNVGDDLTSQKLLKSYSHYVDIITSEECAEHLVQNDCLSNGRWGRKVCDGQFLAGYLLCIVSVCFKLKSSLEYLIKNCFKHQADTHIFDCTFITNPKEIVFCIQVFKGKSEDNSQ